jgi:hypothetical protein
MQQQQVMYGTCQHPAYSDTSKNFMAYHRSTSGRSTELQDTQIAKTMQQNAALTLLDGWQNHGHWLAGQLLLL